MTGVHCIVCRKDRKGMTVIIDSRETFKGSDLFCFGTCRAVLFTAGSSCIGTGISIAAAGNGESRDEQEGEHGRDIIFRCKILFHGKKILSLGQ